VLILRSHPHSHKAALWKTKREVVHPNSINENEVIPVYSAGIDKEDEDCVNMRTVVANMFGDKINT
jgi:hypothetical protein